VERRFSGSSRNRVKRLENNFEICKEMGWSLEQLNELTTFEKNVVIRWINNNRKKQNRELRKLKRR